MAHDKKIPNVQSGSTMSEGARVPGTPGFAVGASKDEPVSRRPLQSTPVGAKGTGARGVASDAGVSPSSAMPSGTQKSKGGSKKPLLIALLLVILAIAVWICVWLFACGGTDLLDPNARDGQAPYKSEAEMQAELDRVVEDGMFNISIASSIQFDDGTSPGTAYIENVPGNHYLMKVVITDDTTGDVLYESGVLKPNQFIESIALTRDLDSGTYPATATFTALDESTYNEVGQAAAKISINVLN